ncbi:hypothetical protein OHA21_19485 [Actinoplanes sp. NBC_00393]|uniref:hypothetical protein n=1 Tax=Actinoplanes sp. NBC_00393 TaxID=2975953 RepID=UPI002E1C4B22
MNRRRIAQLLTVALVCLGGPLTTGSAAHAAYRYQPLSAQGSNGKCTLTIDSPGTFNLGGFKTFTTKTTSTRFGCTLQVFYHSNSTNYEAHVARPNNPSIWGGLVAIHRVRICQSGEPGRCSAYLWWNNTLHTS